MALPAQDSFTTATTQTLTSYSANWTINQGTFSVDATDDRVYCTYSADEAAAHWNADTFGNDQYAQVVLRGGANGTEIGPAVRCAASGATYYGVYADINSGHGWLFKNVSGTWTPLVEVLNTFGAVAGDVLRLEVSGTNLTVKRNGTAVTGMTNISDNAISSGYAGICAYGNNTGCAADDFEGGNLSAAANVPAALLRRRQATNIDSWR